jgi:hypothetical protein
MRTVHFAAALRAARHGLATLTIFALAAGISAVSAEAKPTGWQSDSEIRTGGANAWSGYGDSGYAGRPAKARKARAAKSKALKAYASSYGSKGPKAKTGARKRYAALDTGAVIDTAPAKSLTGGGVRWAASSSCLNGTLASVVGQVAASYGPVTVNSTCRSKARNRAVGGAHRSHHLTGNAVDFRVRGNARAVHAFLRSHGSLGGVKHYGGGLFHVDTGPKRSW